MAYLIEGPSDSVFTAGVAALVEQLRPGIPVETANVVGGGPRLRVRHLPSDRWLAVSFSVEVTEVSAALLDGAAGAITLLSSHDAFARSLSDLEAGRVPTLPPEILTELAGIPGRGQLEPAVDLLSPRQHEVLRALAMGLSNREIGDRLSISANTVRTHLHSIAAKLGIPNARGKIVAEATRAGLLP